MGNLELARVVGVPVGWCLGGRLATIGFRITLTSAKIAITRLILKIQSSNFTCKPNFYSRKKLCLATQGSMTNF